MASGIDLFGHTARSSAASLAGYAVSIACGPLGGPSVRRAVIRLPRIHIPAPKGIPRVHKMRNFRLASISVWLVVLAIALGSLSASSANAQAIVLTPRVTVFDFPFDSTIDSPCGEAIHVTGNQHIKLTLVTNATGGTNSQADSTFDLSAVGLSTGTIYRITLGGSSGVFNVSTTGASTFTIATLMNIIGRGPDNNTQLQFNEQVIFDATGQAQPTVNRVQLAFLCR
jgi:hypothetical protein